MPDEKGDLLFGLSGQLRVTEGTGKSIPLQRCLQSYRESRPDPVALLRSQARAGRGAHLSVRVKWQIQRELVSADERMRVARSKPGLDDRARLDFIDHFERGPASQRSQPKA